ncbi:PaaX family transcriptional regulator C-terminal domain-containing protein [Patescibacteria group bacterium]
MRSKPVKFVTKNLSQASEFVFRTALDFSLWSIAYATTASVPQSRNGQLWRAQIMADNFICDYNYEKIKRAVINAKRRGLIRKNKHHAWPEITKAGFKRLAQTIPVYDEKRIWDGKIYLVTYDIPEKYHYDRDYLRESLIKLGSGKLQNSVWINFFDLTVVIKKLITEKTIHGSVIVSSIGKDGFLGKTHIKSRIIDIYKLIDLNDRYEKWMDSNFDSKNELLLSYLKILNDDPQIPFALLPSWWKGNKAYNEVKGILQKVYINLRS